MRRAFFISVFIMQYIFSGAAYGAESRLADADLSAAVSLVPQETPPGLADVLFEVRAERAGYTLLALAHFPQGVGREVDAKIAAFAQAMHSGSYAGLQEYVEFGVDQYLAGLTDFFAGRAAAANELPLALPPEEPRAWGNTFVSIITWEVSRPSASFISVLFREDTAGGGAHGNWTYRAVSYDARTGAELALQDIFPGAEDVVEKLDALVLSALGRESGGGEDSGDMSVGMDRILLTAEGMRVVYAPYEIGSYADGEFVAELQKADLVKMGARPDLWE